jgi:hypothetical protein
LGLLFRAHPAPQGDLLVHLLSFAAEELSSPVSTISRPRLQSLLELAVRSSSCAGDPHMENLGYTFDPRELPDIARAVLHIASPVSQAAPAGNAPPGHWFPSCMVNRAHLCKKHSAARYLGWQ